MANKSKNTQIAPSVPVPDTSHIVTFTDTNVTYLENQVHSFTIGSNETLSGKIKIYAIATVSSTTGFAAGQEQIIEYKFIAFQNGGLNVLYELVSKPGDNLITFQMLPNFDVEVLIICDPNGDGVLSVTGEIVFDTFY